MGLREKAAKGVFWSGTQVWGGQALSFVTLVVLSRLLAPEAFGLVAYASVFIAFLEIFLDQGFGHAVVQRDDLKPEHLDTAFWTNMLTGAFLAGASAGVSGLVARLFQQPELAGVIRWLSLSFLFGGLASTQQAILRRELAFDKLAIRSLAASAAAGAISVTMACLGFGVWSLVAQGITNALVGAALLWGISRWRPRFRFRREQFVDLFTFGFNVVGTNLLNFLNQHADDFLIGYFLGPTALGYYTVAYRLLLAMIRSLTGVTTAVAFPTFSRLQGEPERMRRALYQATYYTSLVSFPAFAGVAVLAPQLIVVLYGAKWAPSIPVMQVLAFIGILHSVFYFDTNIIYAAGKPSWRLAVTFVNATSNVVAFAIAVRWGIVAVAAAYVMRGYLLSPLEIWVMKRLIGLDVRHYLRQFAVAVTGSVAMAVVVVGLKRLLSTVSLPPQIAACVLAGAAVYMLSVQLLVPSLQRQLLELIRLALPIESTRTEQPERPGV